MIYSIRQGYQPGLLCCFKVTTYFLLDIFPPSVLASLQQMTPTLLDLFRRNDLFLIAINKAMDKWAHKQNNRSPNIKPTCQVLSEELLNEQQNDKRKCWKFFFFFHLNDKRSLLINPATLFRYSFMDTLTKKDEKVVFCKNVIKTRL